VGYIIRFANLLQMGNAMRGIKVVKSVIVEASRMDDDKGYIANSRH